MLNQLYFSNELHELHEFLFLIRKIRVIRCKKYMAQDQIHEKLPDLLLRTIIGINPDERDEKQDQST